MRKILNFIICLLLTLIISGCVSNPNSKVDPYEKFNRNMYNFNDGIDKVIIRPAAGLYVAVVPNFMQKGVSNVLSNVQELTTIPNDMFQGKFRYAARDTVRFVVNTIFGVLGLFDVAKKLGLPKHYEDFGMTLAYWQGGRAPAPYLVLPLLGPMTTRGPVSTAVGIFTNPFTYVHPSHWRYAYLGARIINTRAKLIPADQAVKNAFDPYIFVRNAYLQKRNSMIAKNNGLAPEGNNPTDMEQPISEDIANIDEKTSDKKDDKKGSADAAQTQQQTMQQGQSSTGSQQSQ